MHMSWVSVRSSVSVGGVTVELLCVGVCAFALKMCKGDTYKGVRLRSDDISGERHRFTLSGSTSDGGGMSSASTS
jgi:hypothetical protein